MATIEDVRAIALALPGVTERIGGHTGEPGWRLANGQIAWIRGPSATDLRQLAALGVTWPEGPVLGVRVGSLEEKEALLAAEPGVLFTIPHFDGYPGLLVQLDLIGRDRLAEIIADAWLERAPVLVAKRWLDERGLT
ncbi:MmcQ/YjbR family DNA-binding protein [Microbacterium sp. NPDC089695]|uniref:MmcQ/YjbR family DNA-binding protein n=1 Tax=Microbacterium sp. NPDC089695 TaxID=3364198 RepID=UPI00380D2F43